MEPRLLNVILDIKVPSLDIVEWAKVLVPVHVEVASENFGIVPTIFASLLSMLNSVIFAAVMENAVGVALELIMELKIPCVPQLSVQSFEFILSPSHCEFVCREKLDLLIFVLKF